MTHYDKCILNIQICAMIPSVLFSLPIFGFILPGFVYLVCLNKCLWLSLILKQPCYNMSVKHQVLCLDILSGFI